MVKEGTIEWFKSHVGLPDERFDIRRELHDSHVLVEDYEAIWGKRKANNGFNLGTCNNLGLNVQIQEL
jgi:NOL1/NOP2/fmu family ribosome biogenesis protein